MYTFTRGTNFNFAGQVQNDGKVMDLTGVTVAARIYDMTGTTLIASLTCQIVGDPTLGVISVTYSGDTLGWAPGKVQVLFLLNIPNNPNPLASEPAYFRIAQNPMIG